MKNSTVRNLWTKTNVGTFSTTFSSPINKHGAALFKLTTVSTTVQPLNPGAARDPGSLLLSKTFVATGNTFLVPAEYRDLSLIADIYKSNGKLERSIGIKNGTAHLQSPGVYFVKLKIAE
jgi:hypothetical protein